MDQLPTLLVVTGVAAPPCGHPRQANAVVNDTGVPIRRYLLWLRLADALQVFGQGASLTEVAHTVGFADSAHLTRTFRRMFGLAPSGLLKR